MEFSVAEEDAKTERKQEDLRTDDDSLGESRFVACGKRTDRYSSAHRRHRSSETVIGGLFDGVSRCIDHGSRIHGGLWGC